MRVRRTWSCWGAALLVSACGGGDSADPKSEAAADGGGIGGGNGTPSTEADGGTGDSGSSEIPGVVAPADPKSPAVTRGSSYRGSPEKFHRRYTDPSWKPSKIIYVSPKGGGDGSTKESPTTPEAGIEAAAPGTEVHFLAGAYSGCFELAEGKAGTYDAPIVLSGEREGDARKAVVNCCATGRKTCFNLEAVDYVAVEGFELVGGDYGVRAVGEDSAASKHQKGIAVLDCDGHDQNRDPFFSGQSDWYVIERSLGHGAGSGDGHGIYLSNGSDWLIVRNNELWNNKSSDFQINADPQFSCVENGISATSPDCDDVAGTPGDGGRGATDFALVEGNYFHDGLAQGANFTSARRSIVRNNIFAYYAKHGVSFWQETDNPKLGAADNEVVHNLFVSKTPNRQMLSFIVHSDRNTVANNVFIGVGANIVGMEVDDTVGENTYRHNFYVNVSLDGRTPGPEEHTAATLDPAWFVAFPSTLVHDPQAYLPSATAPFLNLGDLLPNAGTDRTGKTRSAPTDLGPFEL